MLSFARFGLAIELRQAQHRHLQLAGQALQPAGDLGDLLLPRVLGIVRLDELQVVDHDQPQRALPPLEPPGRGGDFGHRAAGRVVDEQRRLREHFAPSRPASAGRPARRCRCAGGGRSRGPREQKQAVGQFERRHFQADEQHRRRSAARATFSAMFIANAVLPMLGRAARMISSPLCRPPVLLVEIAEAGVARRRPCACRPCGRRAAPSPRSTMSLSGWIDVGAAVVEDREDLLLGLAEQLRRFLRFVVGVAEDLGRGDDQRAERRLVAGRSRRSTSRGPRWAPR